MSHPYPIQVELISDDEDDNTTSNSFNTPVSNHVKRPRSEFQSNSTPFFIIDDDPTPQKLRTSASSAISEISLSDSPKTQDRGTLSCESKAVQNPSSGSSSLPRIPTVGGLICLESDDENEECPEWGNWQKNIGTVASFDAGKDLESSPRFAIGDKQWQNEETLASFDGGKDLESSPRFAIGDKQWQNGETSAGFDEENNLQKSSGDIDSSHCPDAVVHPIAHYEAEGSPAKGIPLRNGGRRSDLNVEDYSAKKPDFTLKDSWRRNEAMNADFDTEWLEGSPSVVKATSFEHRKSTKTYESIYLEDHADQILPLHTPDLGINKVRLEADGVNCKVKSGGNADPQLKQNRNEKLTNRKKSQEEKTRAMEEKKLKKQQDQLHKADLKAESAKLRQLEKVKQRWEKECEKNILTEIDPKVLQCGSIGGHLLTRFGEKGLRFNIATNPVEKSIVWRMNVPEELSQLSSVGTDVHYLLLIYGAEEFCEVALDGSIMDHISSVRNRYPSYTICCLTNRLMSYVNKREQDKYRNQKNGSDWERPPVEEVFAKLTTHFTKVHTRQCADEAELADHVVGLTINLAKCCFRKRLTPISVNANECNVPKDTVDRDLILKNTWLKALVAIPKVQPRFAIAVWKKYPTMKSLLSVYFDPTKSVHEKESLLKDLMTEGLLGNEEQRVGEICSKRIYRIFMAQNGVINTDEVENDAEYFTTNLNCHGEEQVIPRSVLFLCESPVCV